MIHAASERGLAGCQNHGRSSRQGKDLLPLGPCPFQTGRLRFCFVEFVLHHLHPSAVYVAAQPFQVRVTGEPGSLQGLVKLGVVGHAVSGWTQQCLPCRVITSIRPDSLARVPAIDAVPIRTYDFPSA